MSDAQDSVTELAPDAAYTENIDAISADDEPPPPPRKARRRKLPFVTLVLGLAAAVGVGFFAGVRVEKGQISPTASTAQSSALANAFRNAAGGRGAATNPSPSTSTGTAGSAANANGGANATGPTNIIGTVATVDGQTLYVTDQSGDTVKVTTSGGTTVTKTTTGAVKDLNPGDTVVIRAVPAGTGVFAAQSVTEGGSGGLAGFAGGFGGRGGGGRARATTSPSPAAAG